MASPFEDEISLFRILVNNEGQHSLWPSSIEIPAGWVTVHGPTAKAACLEFVESNWTDLRPLGLIKAMAPSSCA